jgi:hypothetical protein
MHGIILFLAAICLPVRAAEPSCNGASEVVQVLRQDDAAIPQPPRTACPHRRSDLVPFESRFSGVATGATLRLSASDKLLLGAPSLPAGVVLKRIIVPAGAVLVIANANVEINLHELVVESGGELWAGSESCPINAQVRFVFHGTKAMNANGGSSKGLLSSGKVEIHGLRFRPTWTRLAQTAEVGANTIRLQQSVNWQPNQEIVLSTTTWYDCPPKFQKEWCRNQPHQNEVREIASVSSDGRQVTLKQSLDFLHYAGPEYQGEVALLSRTVEFVGTPSTVGFGGHTKVSGGTGRFSGIRAINMGQLNVMARYPFHFHMLGACPTCYVQDCSITSSNFRAITIHGSDETTVQRNVGFDITGSAVYLEDGVEEDNVIKFNFMAHVHPIKVFRFFWNVFFFF